MEIKQIHELAAAYSAAGLTDTWAGGFLMKLSQNEEMPRGRGKAILSDLIEKGPPECWPHWNLAINALEAAKKKTLPDEVSALHSIAGQIRAGKSITENQVAYVKRLIATSDEQRKLHDVTADDAAWIAGIAAKFNATNFFYWDRKPGARSKITRALGHFDAPAPAGSTKQVPQESWSFLTEYYAKDWSEWNDCLGSFGKLRRHEGSLCLVFGLREMRGGYVHVTVLKDGTPTCVRYRDLKVAERAPRKKKAV